MQAGLRVNTGEKNISFGTTCSEKYGAKLHSNFLQIEPLYYKHESIFKCRLRENKPLTWQHLSHICMSNASEDSVTSFSPSLWPCQKQSVCMGVFVCGTESFLSRGRTRPIYVTLNHLPSVLPRLYSV